MTVRLSALEQATTTKSGYRVFYADTAPGLYWTSPKRDRDGEPALTQADVDKAEQSHNVIVVEYVQRWHDDQSPAMADRTASP